MSGISNHLLKLLKFVMCLSMFSAPVFAAEKLTLDCVAVNKNASVKTAKLVADLDKRFPNNMSLILEVYTGDTIKGEVEMTSLPDGVRYQMKNSQSDYSFRTYLFKTGNNFAILMEPSGETEDTTGPLLVFLQCKNN